MSNLLNFIAGVISTTANQQPPQPPAPRNKKDLLFVRANDKQLKFIVRII